MTTINQVNVNTLADWLNSGEAILIDVRETGEHQSEYIDGSRNLPLSRVTLDEVHLPEHKGKKIVVHCLSGGRSAKACQKLVCDEASINVWDLEGGINAWKNAGLKVVASRKKTIPLDRQLQLTIGTMVLVGVGLGYFVSPEWLALSALAGAGLTNAGLTGICPMANVMAKMPWNQA
jgi:rhodanese-related sulfurtransferase